MVNDIMFESLHFSSMDHQTKQFLTVLLMSQVYSLLLEAFKKAIPTKHSILTATNISPIILHLNELSIATFVMKNLSTNTFFGFIKESISLKMNAYYVHFAHL